MRLAARNDHQETSGDEAAVATYIATMAADLAVMARSRRLDGLGYILDMARLEAESLVRTLARKG